MEELKSYFPLLVTHPELVYLDNAATTQKPAVVIECMDHFYREENSNTHRGVYDLSSNATRRYEEARNYIAEILGASGPDNIGFTKGTTESINIIAGGFLRKRLNPGDNVVVTIMEHHANFIPWQLVCKETGAELRIVGIDENGDLDFNNLESFLDERTKMLAVTHVSNTLGTVNPVAELIIKAHKKSIPVLLDAAQSVSGFDIDVSSLDCDFLAFSGHKTFGPMGIGVLYVADKWTGEVGPVTYGGGMVAEVTETHTEFKPFPYCLEAGTSNVPGVLGLAEALRFLSGFDRQVLHDHVVDLGEKCRAGLSGIDGLNIFGTARERTGIISFGIKNSHPHDIASFLNKDNIAVRAGMHCTQPLLNSMGLQSTVRASFSIYNSEDEVDHLIDSVKRVQSFLS